MNDDISERSLSFEIFGHERKAGRRVLCGIFDFLCFIDINFHVHSIVPARGNVKHHPQKFLEFPLDHPPNALYTMHMKINLTPEKTEPYDIHSAGAGFHRCVENVYGKPYKDMYIVHKKSKDCREVIIYWCENSYPEICRIAELSKTPKYLPVTKPFTVEITP